MSSKCPGQDTRNLKTELITCPKCGVNVEMFSDETRFKCPKCGGMVYKDHLPSCIEWCSAARQCLGEERWQAMMAGKEKPADNTTGEKG